MDRDSGDLAQTLHVVEVVAGLPLDLGEGQVHGVDFETPEDRAAQISRGSIHLSDNRSLLDLLRDLRGRRVRLHMGDDRPDPKKGFGLNAEVVRPLK